MFLESGVNECYVKRIGINVIAHVNIGEVGLLTIYCVMCGHDVWAKMYCDMNLK